MGGVLPGPLLPGLEKHVIYDSEAIDSRQDAPNEQDYHVEVIPSFDISQHQVPLADKPGRRRDAYDRDGGQGKGETSPGHLPPGPFEILYAPVPLDVDEAAGAEKETGLGQTMVQHVIHGPGQAFGGNGGDAQEDI